MLGLLTDVVHRLCGGPRFRGSSDRCGNRVCVSESATDEVVHTSEVICGPGAKLTGSASVLIKHELVLFAGSAGPTAAHLSFTDHLETQTHQYERLERSQCSNGNFL